MDTLELLHENPKHNAVLEAAVAVFGRFGFQKASMEAVARAAGISRPGLYLMFPNKEQLYRATMQGVLERAQRAMQARLADQSLSFDERIVAGIDALMGPYIENPVARDLNELLENSRSQLGSMLDDYESKAQATLSAYIAEHAPPGLLEADLTAHDVMDLLLSAAITWKATSSSRDQYRDRIRRSLRLIHRPAR
ncbi:TetR/AcrR family transcriptional regulator [Micromonospora sp. NPDC049114]|uniref:TetR/AcrR family transcriptional regulator n=1 Tax=unclassified Micromonospora TaxID=2617518 RepID=UPI0033CE3456